MSYLDLTDNKAYQTWVDHKRTAYERRSDSGFSLLFRLNQDGVILAQALSEMRDQINDYNFAL